MLENNIGTARQFVQPCCTGEQTAEFVVGGQSLRDSIPLFDFGRRCLCGLRCGRHGECETVT